MLLVSADMRWWACGSFTLRVGGAKIQLRPIAGRSRSNISEPLILRKFYFLKVAGYGSLIFIGYISNPVKKAGTAETE
jgi:hypothetical protein